MMSLRRTLFVLGLLTLSTPLAAQDAATTLGLEDLQSKGALSEDELSRVTEWVTTRIRDVATSSSAAKRAVTELRLAHHGGDEGFRRAFARTANDLIRQSYARAQLLAATQMIALLGSFDDMAAHPTLLEALGDERVGVRTAAAVGLARMRGAIVQAGGNVVAATLAALVDAGKNEASAVALKSMYRAMDFQSSSPSGDPQAVARALLELLDGRAKLYAAGKPSAWGAETAAIDIAGRLRGSLSNGDKTRLTGDLGQILIAAGTRYTERLMTISNDSSSRVDIELRDTTEQLVYAAEGLLANLLTWTGDTTVADHMRKLEKTEMKLKLKEWGKLLNAATGETFDVDGRAGAWTE
jgi:hypothetical protein